MTGVEFLDAFNRGWVFSTAMRIVVVGGGDTSIDVASVARRLGHIGQTHAHDRADQRGIRPYRDTTSPEPCAARA